MKIEQIAIFMENKPGHLRTICGVLADAGVNIVTLSLADTKQDGLLRLLTDNIDATKKALAENFVARVDEVLAVEVDDKPGGLLKLLDIISEGGINIEYMYAFTFRRSENAIMVFRFDNPDKAIEALQRANVKVLPAIDLFQGA